MRKFCIKNSNTIITTTALSILMTTLCFLIAYSIKMFDIDTSKNNAFTKNAKFVIIQTEKEIDSLEFKGVGIYKVNPNFPYSAYEVISLDGKLSVAGRLRVPNDFQNGNYAIIGSKVKEFLDVDSLTIDGKKYLVQMEFTDKEIPSNNCVIFYNGDHIIRSDKKIYIIDSIDKGNIEKAIDKLRSIVEANGYGKITETESNKLSISDFISYRKMLIYLFTVFAIIILYTDFLVCVFRLISMKREISVLVLIGKPNITLSIIKSVFFPIIFSFVIGIAGTYTFVGNFHYTFTAALLCSIILLTENIVTSVLFCARFLKQEFSKMAELDDE